MVSEFSRRHFARLAGLAALGASLPATAAEKKQAMMRFAPASFPKGFVWGTATSSYQIVRIREISLFVGRWLRSPRFFIRSSTILWSSRERRGRWLCRRQGR